ncbi:MAG TPA: phosphate ABC transporter permease PstA [Methanomicrobiales archaeon]|nr:phosphate ABC transporter permease PstA [Methanomicrobiales archaeon]
MRRRRLKEKVVKSICFLAALTASLTLFLILGTIFLKAIPSLTLYFITTTESAAPGVGGGILNDIVGTLILSLSATLIATPVALGTAVYLQRYARPGRIVRVIRLFIEVLSGTPSIVIGMFGFLVFVYYMQAVTGGFSLLSGSIALAILIVPVIERAIEDAIATVDRTLEDGSYALGSTKWQTIRGITLPVAISGILTGVILGFGRAAEESAVVLLTAGYTQFMPEIAVKANPKYLFGLKIYPFQDLVGTLPVSVYNAYENANVIPLSNGFAAAFVLIAVVLSINLVAKGILLYSFRSRGGKTGRMGGFVRELVGSIGSYGAVLKENNPFAMNGRSRGVSQRVLKR